MLFVAPYTYNWQDNWVYGGNTGTNTIILPSDPSKQSVLLLYLDGPTGNPTWITGTEAPLYTNAKQLLPYLPTFSSSLGIPLAMIVVPSGTTSLAWSNIYDIRQFFTGFPIVSGTSSGIPEAPIDGNTYGRKNAGWSVVSGSSGGSGGNVSDTGATTANHIAVWNGTNDHTIKDGGVAPLPSNSSIFSSCFCHWQEGFMTSGSYTNVISFNASQILSFYGNSSTGCADGDERTFYVPLKAGTYTFECYFQRNTNRGKVDIYMDGTTFATAVDLYAASSIFNSVTTITGITVTGDGLHTIKFKINGKNASSGTPYYVMAFTYFTMNRTGA
jgi:hypothetical protein